MSFLAQNKNYRLLISIAFLLLIVSSFLFYKTKQSDAIFGYGGRIASITLCTCSEGLLYVKLGPPTGGDYIVKGSSVNYAYYDIWGKGTWTFNTWLPTPGVWIVGSYTVPAPQCLMMGEPCTTLPPAKGLILDGGASLGTAI